MNRTQMFKAFYVLVIAAGVAVVLYLVINPPVRRGWLIVIAIALFIPGRLGEYFLRDLFRSRRLNARADYRGAIDAANAMLAKLRRQPWRRWFIFCHYAIYSWNVEAMTLNNLAVGQMMCGDLDGAAANLASAIERDRKYPKPYFNLAVIEHVRGNTDEGERLFELAAKLGFSNSAADQLIDRVQSAYAAVAAVGPR